MRVVRIAHLEIGRLPRVVGTVTTLPALRRISRLRKRWFHIVEVRADRLADPLNTWLDRCADIRRAGLPVLLTVRARREGGGWQADEATRRTLYRQGLAVADAVDIEIRSRFFRPVAREAHENKRTVIGSFHDFSGTPKIGALRKIIEQGRSGGADIVKIATHICRPSDVAELFNLLEENEAGPLCLIGMGPRGIATRTRLAWAGSCLVYGYLDRPAAPGQLSCRELVRRLARGHPDFANDLRTRNGA